MWVWVLEVEQAEAAGQGWLAFSEAVNLLPHSATGSQDTADWGTPASTPLIVWLLSQEYQEFSKWSAKAEHQHVNIHIQVQSHTILQQGAKECQDWMHCYSEDKS